MATNSVEERGFICCDDTSEKSYNLISLELFLADLRSCRRLILVEHIALEMGSCLDWLAFYLPKLFQASSQQEFFNETLQLSRLLLSDIELERA